MKHDYMRGAATARRRLRRLVWLQIVTLLFGQCSIGLANPLGGTVVSGSATIHQHANTTHIHQATNRAIINWQGFSIGAGETTQFFQPGANAAILNRVTGAQMSQLLGTLQANGNVYLINPNGILIGQGATITVGGFTASTLDVNNAEFMRGGDLTFSGNSKASVINRGNVTALGGDIYLIGAHVENHGVLRSVSGTVGLAAGQEVRLVDSTHQALVVRATDRSLGGTGVLNTGIIDGVRAELAANGGNVYALAINNKGVVRANGSVTRNGRVLLTAPGGTIASSGDLIAKNTNGSGGEVTINSASAASISGATAGSPRSANGVTNLSGHIDVSGVSGGRVQVLGDEVNLTGATIDAYGTADGGVVLIGGDYQGRNPAIPNAQRTTVDAGSIINVDSTLLGDGGRVIVWADDATQFAGNISARGGTLRGNGGFAEVSGMQTLNYSGLANLSAAAGATGTLLLDPTNFPIGATEAATIVGNLANANVVVATAAAGAQDGDVTISAPILYTSANDFAILAHGDIFANASVQNDGSGDVSLVAGWDGMTEAPGGSGINSPAAFDITNIFNAAASFGNNNGSVFIGNAAQASGIAVGSRFGATNVAADGLTLRGSDTANDSFAQLGFRADSSQMNFNINGSIDVALIGNLTANGGGRQITYAQVGHGGWDFSSGTEPGGDFQGAITIRQANDLNFMGGSGTGANAQLGHGGTNAKGNHSGTITIARANDLNFAGGSSDFANAQLGHGGFTASGNHSGAITIMQARDLTFTGSSSDFTYAQLGHGGRSADGNHSGAITIARANNLTLTGGSDLEAYAQLGHGDPSGHSGGTRMGDIDVRITGETSLVNGSGQRSFWLIGHATTDVISSANVTLITGTLDYSTATSSTLFDIPANALGADFAAKMIGNLAGGHVTLGATNGTPGTTGGMTVASPFIYDSANNLSFLSTTDIRFGASVQNRGSVAGAGPARQVNVVAGWDGMTGVASPLVISEIFGDVNSFGNNMGSVFIGDAAQTAGIAIGSRVGANNVAAHDLTLRAASNSLDAFAHLGWQGVVGPGGPDSNAPITLALKGDLSAIAGGRVGNYAQVGHGGRNRPGSNRGLITITQVHDLIFTGGQNRDAYAQLGHGGGNNDSGSSGQIIITRANDLSFTAGNSLGAYVQLGNGGRSADGNHNGAITITKANNLTFTSGASEGFAQLGHGGHLSRGNNRGDITIAEANNITFNSTGFYSQLGHGGRQVDGNHSGKISIQANNLALIGGTNAVSYTQLGHGEVTGTSTGTRMGNIDVRITGETSLVNGTGTWQIGHADFPVNNIRNADVTLITGTLDFDATGTTTFFDIPNDANGTDFAEKMIANLEGGAVTLGATNGTQGITGGMTVASTFTYDSPNNLSFLSTTDIRFDANVQNGGMTTDPGPTGEVNVVAGWDGTTGVASPLVIGNIFGDASSFGNNNGSVFIGDGAQTAGIAIGSRFGPTNVAAHDLNLRGSNGTSRAFAQLGFRDTSGAITSIDGPIDIALTGNLNATAGNRFAAYVQVGHGGRNGNGDYSGAITITADNDLTFTGVGIVAYAQLGHGGFNANGNHSGNITITQAHDLTFTGGFLSAYAQLGHGGEGADGAGVDGGHSGAITITADNDLTFMGGSDIAAYAQLGHGGKDADGNHSGNITITQALDLTFTGGVLLAYAQLGHGGGFADGNHSGNITITQALDLTFTGGGLLGYAQLGHGDASGGSSGTRMGDIDVRITAETSLVNGSVATAPWLIGHRTTSVSAISNANVTLITGTLDYNTATSTSTLFDISGSGGDDFARKMIDNLEGGHVTLGATNGMQGPMGGMTVAAPFIYDSPNNLSFLSTTDIRFDAGVQNGGTTAAPDPTGEVNVVAGWDGVTGVASPLVIGDIFGDVSSFGNNNGSVFIGNGMQTSGIAVGSRFGATNVAADGLTLRGSNRANDGFAQLGFRVDSNIANVDIDGDITVLLNSNLSAIGGSRDRVYAQVGHGGGGLLGLPIPTGNFRGDILVTTMGDLIFTGGSDVTAYAQLGHGGALALGDHSGDITIAQAHDLTFMGGMSNNTYAQLGHGGTLAFGDHSGAITITQANDLTFTGGSVGNAYAQLGHGGAFADGDHSGDITITHVNDSAFRGGGGNQAYAQLGHGGFFADGDHSGAITITQANDLNFIGVASSAYAQLGHGGRNVDGDHSGAITITQANDLNFAGGFNGRAYAQLGHGGAFASGNHSGDITITRANDLNFSGGSRNAAYAQLGHGGAFVFGDQNGEITITRANNLVFMGGGDFAAYAQLGHGGVGVEGDQSGNINILQANNLTFMGGSGENAYAQLGHGGTAVETESEEQPLGAFTQANQIGNIFVRLVGSDLFLTGGTGPNAYAQLGHGDASGHGSGLRNGNIQVIIDGSAVLAGNSNTAPALLGHATTTPGGINGNLTLAIDQINPLADNGGRLFMNQFSAIDMGGAPNQVRIFGTRRLGNVLADGAVINGVVVDSSLPPGTFTGDRWNPNVEFTNWNYEQWGPLPNLYTLAQPGPFTAPFTFFFLGDPSASPQVFPLPYDRFIRYSDYADTIFQLFPNGPYRMYYGQWPERPLEDEETGATSADVYSP